MPFTAKNGHLIKAFQKEKHDTVSQQWIKNLPRETGVVNSLIKSLLEKVDKFGSVSTFVQDVAQLDHAVIVQWRPNDVSSWRFEAGVYIVNIDFDLS